MKISRTVPKKARIEIIPMIDTMFFLLVFFMMATLSMTNQYSLPVNLPKAQSPAIKQTKSDVIVTIQQGDKIYVGDSTKPLDITELQDELQMIYANKQQKDLFIKADMNLRYGMVIDVMSAAKKAGVDRIGMLTQPETKAE